MATPLTRTWMHQRWGSARLRRWLQLQWLMQWWSAEGHEGARGALLGVGRVHLTYCPPYRICKDHHCFLLLSLLFLIFGIHVVRRGFPGRIVVEVSSFSAIEPPQCWAHLLPPYLLVTKSDRGAPSPGAFPRAPHSCFPRRWLRHCESSGRTPS